MNIYITPEQYARAAANGVTYSALNSRVRALGWDMERAMTTPPRVQRRHEVPKEWEEMARKNGISRQMFAHRILFLGWDPERAATISKADARRLRDESRRTINQEERDQAKAVGVSIGLAHQRLYKGWPRDKAFTTPPTPRNKRQRKPVFV